MSDSLLFYSVRYGGKADMLIAARGLPVEKRSLFLQRVASDLELRRVTKDRC